MTRLPVQLILLGPPGAGKGTQAARLARRLGLIHVNPGQILREAAAGESPVSRDIRDRMAAGQLVDDQLVDRLVRERLEALSPGQGFILDGYPRTAGEARSLQKTLAGLHRLRQPLLVVWLQASATSSSGDCGNVPGRSTGRMTRNTRSHTGWRSTVTPPRLCEMRWRGGRM